MCGGISSLSLSHFTAAPSVSLWWFRSVLFFVVVLCFSLFCGGPLSSLRLWLSFPLSIFAVVAFPPLLAVVLAFLSLFFFLVVVFSVFFCVKEAGTTTAKRENPFFWWLSSSVFSCTGSAPSSPLSGVVLSRFVVEGRQSYHHHRIERETTIQEKEEGRTGAATTTKQRGRVDKE